MKYKVIGVEEKRGSFTRDGEKVEYDNVILHCACAEDNFVYKLGMICGARVAEIKLKNDFNALVYVGEFRDVVRSFIDLLDCTVDIAMDAEGKILGLQVVNI